MVNVAMVCSLFDWYIKLAIYMVSLQGSVTLQSFLYYHPQLQSTVKSKVKKQKLSKSKVKHDF